MLAMLAATVFMAKMIGANFSNSSLIRSDAGSILMGYLSPAAMLPV